MTEGETKTLATQSLQIDISEVLTILCRQNPPGRWICTHSEITQLDNGRWGMAQVHSFQEDE